MSLYKYTSAGNAAHLSTHSLRFSPPSEFNDPFDGIPETFALEKMPAYIGFLKGCEDSTQWPLLLKGTQLEGRTDLKIEEIKTEAKRLYQEKLKADLANFGVLCLSKVAPDTTAAALMWGHYATDTVSEKGRQIVKPHAGIAYEFDSNSEWFSAHRFDGRNGCHYEEVRYLPRRASIEADGIKGLFVKSEPWKYEEEVRLVRCKKGFSQHESDIVTYPPDMLRAVIVGHYASEATLHKVIEELNRCAEFDHVRIYKLILDPDEYRFKKVEVSRS